MGIPVVDKRGKCFANTMKIYFKEIGVPPDLVSDGAREQVQGKSLSLEKQSGFQIVEL